MKLKSLKNDWLELDKASHTLRKEVIYAGEDFIKGVWLSKSEVMSGVRFDVSEKRLEDIAQQVSAFVDAGEAIPFTRGHKDWWLDDKHMGQVVAARVLDNKLGKPALYLDVRFDSKKDLDEALKADVSIGLEDSVVKLGGKSYETPLRHLASTPVPVIQKLEPWSQPEDNMDLAPVLAELNLDNDALLLEGVKSLKSELAALREKVSSLPKIELSNEVSPVLVKGYSDLRKNKLELSVNSFKMSPVVAAKLAEVFVSDARVGLELSNGDVETFNKVVEIVEAAVANPPIQPNGRSVVELSHQATTKSELEEFLAARRKAKAEFDAKNSK